MCFIIFSRFSSSIFINILQKKKPTTINLNIKQELCQIKLKKASKFK